MGEVWITNYRSITWHPSTPTTRLLLGRAISSFLEFMCLGFSRNPLKQGLNVVFRLASVRMWLAYALQIEVEAHFSIPPLGVSIPPIP
jgi:hypothetical protein